MKRFLLIFISLAILLSALGLGANHYFKSHYFPGSSIDGQDVSWQERSWEHIEGLDESFRISSEKLGLDFQLLEGQLSYHYDRPALEDFTLKAINFTSTRELVYDRELLKDQIAKLVEELPENRPAQDALLKVEDGKLIRKKAHEGYDFPSEEELLEIVEKGLQEKNYSWNLDPYILQAKELAQEDQDKYLALKDYSITNIDYDWTLEDEDLLQLYNEDLSLNEEKAKQAFYDYFDWADGGATIWKVDQEASLPAFMEALREKEEDWQVSYERVRRHHNGNTMNNGIAVSLDRQWLWVFQNGQEIFQAPVVTGNPNRGYSTHRGNWTILNKATDTRLANTNREGHSYDVPVSYWMQFNNMGMIEGFHDATWHWAFGTDVYLYDGSHGCVNLSTGDMPILYNLAYVGMPVWVY